jgi:hypothetical protein
MGACGGVGYTPHTLHVVLFAPHVDSLRNQNFGTNPPFRCGVAFQISLYDMPNVSSLWSTSGRRKGADVIYTYVNYSVNVRSYIFSKRDTRRANVTGIALNGI